MGGRMVSPAYYVFPNLEDEHARLDDVLELLKISEEQMIQGWAKELLTRFWPLGIDDDHGFTYLAASGSGPYTMTINSDGKIISELPNMENTGDVYLNGIYLPRFLVELLKEEWDKGTRKVICSEMKYTLEVPIGTIKIVKRHRHGDLIFYIITRLNEDGKPFDPPVKK